MSATMKMTAIVTIECKARTLGDLRELVQWCDKYRVSDKSELDWGSGSMFIDLSGTELLPAEWIECGDHIPPDHNYDVIVVKHEHE